MSQSTRAALFGARLIGVIEGEQIDGKKRIRNDRLLAVAEANHTYAYLRRSLKITQQDTA